jgi:hypothetical protein
MGGWPFGQSEKEQEQEAGNVHNEIKRAWKGSLIKVFKMGVRGKVASLAKLHALSALSGDGVFLGQDRSGV